VLQILGRVKGKKKKTGCHPFQHLRSWKKSPRKRKNKECRLSCRGDEEGEKKEENSVARIMKKNHGKKEQVRLGMSKSHQLLNGEPQDVAAEGLNRLSH